VCAAGGSQRCFAAPPSGDVMSRQAAADGRAAMMSAPRDAPSIMALIAR